jgi:hypothetical protein
MRVTPSALLLLLAATIAPVAVHAQKAILLTKPLSGVEEIELKNASEKAQQALAPTACPNAKDASGNDECQVFVHVLPVYDKHSSSIYCKAKVSKIVFTGTASANPWKKIVWTLEPSAWPFSAAPGEFTFHETHGIALITNQQKQIVVRGLGDGMSDDAKKFHAHNKHRVADEVIYLPFVIFHPTGGEPSSCAGTDPKVVNN